jgi:hypothetical protein
MQLSIWFKPIEKIWEHSSPGYLELFKH